MISLVLLLFIGFMLVGIIDDIGIIGIILVFLGLFALLVLFVFIGEWVGNKRREKNPEEWERRKRMEEERRKNEQARQDSKKYHDYQYRCPMCRSSKVRDLSFDEKTDPFKASGRVGKNYHCDNCKYVW